MELSIHAVKIRDFGPEQQNSTGCILCAQWCGNMQTTSRLSVVDDLKDLALLEAQIIIRPCLVVVQCHELGKSGRRLGRLPRQRILHLRQLRTLGQQLRFQ